MHKVKNKFFLAVVLFITFALFHVSRASASTQVSDDIVTDTEWTMDGSPYVLTSPIQVASSAKLTIDPGVTVTYSEDFYPFQKEVGIIVSSGSNLIVGSADGPRVHMDSVSIQSNLSGMSITNADVRGLVAYSSHLALSSMTMKSIWLYQSTATAASSSLLGDTTYESLVGGNSTLTMQDGTIDSVNPDLESLGIDATGTVNLTNVTVRSKSTGIYMKGFALLVAHNVLIENCPIDGIMMKKVDPGFQSFDNHIYLVNTEIAGNGAGIEASDWPYFEMEGDSIHDNGTGFKYTGPAPFTVSVMHMQNDWWGDASGPYNQAGNPSGKGNAVADLTVFTPWLTTEPFPSTYAKSDDSGTTSADGGGSTDTTQTQTTTTTTTTQTTSAHTPVLIVPGVLGTEMSDGSGTTLWLDILHTIADIGDGFMDSLGFNADLTPRDPNIVLGDVLGKKINVAGVSLFDYSDALVNEFKDQGYAEGTDLFVFPYDWRDGVSENIVSQLKQKIADIEAQTGSVKVDIVAHSTGGLIVKKYVSENPSDSGIGKAVFVGVPNAGAPKALKVLLQGDNFGVPLLADSEIQKIARNLPVVYDLAPSSTYYKDVGSYLETIQQGFLSSVRSDLSFDQSNDRLKNAYGLNATAVDGAATLHSSDFDGYDLRSAGIDLYAINGCKTGTIGKMAEVHSQDLLGNPLTSYAISGEVPGDGTVPFASASDIPISGDHVYYALKADHAEMMSEDGIRQEIVNILSGSSAPVDSSLVTQDVSQCHLNGRVISIYSPLSIDVTDASGNHAGISSDGASIEDSIPNADYEILGDHKFVYLPTDAGQTYSIKVAGTADGDFTLTDASIANDAVTGMQVFGDVPVTSKSAGSLILGPTDTLTLGSDGDKSTSDSMSPTQTLGASDAQNFFPLTEKAPVETTAVSSGASSQNISMSSGTAVPATARSIPAPIAAPPSIVPSPASLPTIIPIQARPLVLPSAIPSVSDGLKSFKTSTAPNTPNDPIEREVLVAHPSQDSDSGDDQNDQAALAFKSGLIVDPRTWIMILIASLLLSIFLFKLLNRTEE